MPGGTKRNDTVPPRLELLLRLKHMIVSHHGSYEFGAPRLPMTPEAIALHYLDNLDAKIHSFTRDIREDRNGASACGNRRVKGTHIGAKKGPTWVQGFTCRGWSFWMNHDLDLVPRLPSGYLG